MLFLVVIASELVVGCCCFLDVIVVISEIEESMDQ